MECQQTVGMVMHTRETSQENDIVAFADSIYCLTLRSFDSHDISTIVLNDRVLGFH